MGLIKKISIFLGKIIIAAALVSLAFWASGKRNVLVDLRRLFQGFQNTTSTQLKLPEKQNPKQADFKWTYGGKQYEIKETLFGSINDFYAAQPKQYSYQGDLPADWKEKFFQMFLQPAAGDDAISKLAADIKAAGLKNNLNNDQVAELVLSFVQSIPYDEAKAKQILGGQGQGLINYPYETLYTNKGVCSDKSFLVTLLLRELGYGTALFVYESEQHMAVGIQCPQQYSTYGSGYCYAETTTVGNRIGMIPTLSSQDNQAQAIKKLNLFDSGAQDQFDAKRLGPVEIFEKTSGKVYAGIANTIKISQQIDNLMGWLTDNKAGLVAASAQINNEKSELEDLKDKLDKYLKKGDYEKYNDLVPEYNSKLSDLQKKIQKYNSQVKAYNQKVSEYNNLIASFQ